MTATGSTTTTSLEGEFFVDEQQTTIASKDTWQNMSIKELYGVKTQIENKYWDFSSNKIIASSLQRSLSEIDQLILMKEASVF